MVRPVALACALCLLLMVGCTGHTTPGSGTAQPAVQASEDLIASHSLPPFPVDKAVSASFISEVFGKDSYDRSLNAIENGTALELYSGSNEISWGIWRFSPGMQVVSSVQVVLSVPAGSEVYIALADFAKNSWSFSGPVTAGQSMDLVDAKHRSPLGNVYIALVTAGGASATAQKFILTSAWDWSIVTVDEGSYGVAGAYSCLRIVWNRPAISYAGDEFSGLLRYVRANDDEGLSWGAPVEIGVFGWTRHTSMCLFVSEPGICYYYDDSPGVLKFVLAEEPHGDSWRAPVIVAEGPGSLQDVGLYASMARVDGYPSVAYYSAADPLGLYFVQCDDFYGVAWGDPVLLDPHQVAYTTLMQDPDDTVLVSYYAASEGQLRVIGKSESNPTWNPPQIIDAEGDVGQYASGALIGPMIAISYYDATNGDLKYTRYDLQHSEWPKLTLDSAGDVGQHTSLADINGVPAIAYYDVTNGDLKYIQANDASGSTWGEPVLVDSLGDVGLFTSLAEIDGRPAISYYDATNKNLKYAILAE